MDRSVLIVQRHVRCWLCQIGQDSNVIAPLPFTAEATLDDVLKHLSTRYPGARLFHREHGRVTEYQVVYRHKGVAS